MGPCSDNRQDESGEPSRRETEFLGFGQKSRSIKDLGRIQAQDPKFWTRYAVEFDFF
jgi:hypothetical protein